MSTDNELITALRRIAATPLWGESIPGGPLRDAYIFAGEYDIGEDAFNPSCDTESTQLRDAVEDARTTLDAFDAGCPAPTDTASLTDLVAMMAEAMQWQEMADADPDASHRKGYFEHARESRRAALARARALTAAAGKGGES